MDMLARKLDINPGRVEAPKLHPAGRFPYTTKAGLTYDTGNYEPALTLALEKAGYEELRNRQKEAREASRYLGIGISAYVEICGIGPSSVLGGNGSGSR